MAFSLFTARALRRGRASREYRRPVKNRNDKEEGGPLGPPPLRPDAAPVTAHHPVHGGEADAGAFELGGVVRRRKARNRSAAQLMSKPTPLSFTKKCASPLRLIAPNSMRAGPMFRPVYFQALPNRFCIRIAQQLRIAHGGKLRLDRHLTWREESVMRISATMTAASALRSTRS